MQFAKFYSPLHVMDVFHCRRDCIEKHLVYDGCNNTQQVQPEQ